MTKVRRPKWVPIWAEIFFSFPISENTSKPLGIGFGLIFIHPVNQVFGPQLAYFALGIEAIKNL